LPIEPFPPHGKLGEGEGSKIGEGERQEAGWVLPSRKARWGGKALS